MASSRVAVVGHRARYGGVWCGQDRRTVVPYRGETTEDRHIIISLHTAFHYYDMIVCCPSVHPSIIFDVPSVVCLSVHRIDGFLQPPPSSIHGMDSWIRMAARRFATIPKYHTLVNYCRFLLQIYANRCKCHINHGRRPPSIRHIVVK